MSEQELAKLDPVSGVELKLSWKDGKVVAEADLSPAALLLLLKGHGSVPDAIIDGLEKALGVV